MPELRSRTAKHGRRSSPAASCRSGPRGLRHADRRRCQLLPQEEAVDAILHERVKPGDVVVVRYEGPRGGPGMPEMLRREALESDGGYAPKLRDRFVSPTLRAYAAMATSADTGAVRDNNAVERAVAAAAQSRAPVS